MKAVKAIAKTFTIGAGLVSLVAVAETYYDQKFYTANFMDEVKEVRLSLPTQPEKRIVASQEKELPLVQEVSLDNSGLIDGEWKITKVINDLGEVTYDIENDYNKEPVVVDMKLISLSTVRIDNDLDQTFKVSYLTENGTIALFKEFGEGYEIVQASKYTRPVKIKKVVPVVKKVEEKKEEVKAPKYHIEEELVAMSGIDPKVKGAIRGEQVQGIAYLQNGELILEGAAIHIGTNRQSEQVSTEVRLKGHGAFNDDNGIAGVVTNVTKDEVKVRFSTGPLAGVMLNFVTAEKRRKIEDKYAESFRENQQPIEQAQPINAQAEVPQMYPEERRAEEQELYEQELREQELYEEEQYYEEANGERVNESQLPEFEDGADFQEMRMEQEQTRYPSSVEISKSGFSF